MGTLPEGSEESSDLGFILWDLEAQHSNFICDLVFDLLPMSQKLQPQRSAALLTQIPSHPRRALVFVSHGAGEHCGRYDELAQMLVGLELLVFAHDHGECPQGYQGGVPNAGWCLTV